MFVYIYKARLFSCTNRRRREYYVNSMFLQAKIPRNLSLVDFFFFFFREGKGGEGREKGRETVMCERKNEQLHMSPCGDRPATQALH